MCAFLNVTDSSLTYRVFEPSSGVPDCWRGLEASGVAAYEDLRVWEQVGFSHEPDRLLSRYKDAVDTVILKGSEGLQREKG